MQSGTEVDVDIVRTGAGNGGVPHGQLLLEFVDAAMAVDPTTTAAVRERLIAAAGDLATVDAAAVTAMFQLNTRAADAAGISIEERTVEARSDMGVRLGFAARPEGVAP